MRKKKKKEDDDKGSASLYRNTYYGDVVQGRLAGKDVCVKILSGLKPDVQKSLIEKYSKAKKILGHRCLLTPIGIVQEPPQTGEQKTEKPPRLIVELALNEYHSLDDIITSNYKIGFHQKLYTAKCVAQAMSWLHEQNFYHLRLKPSNILFTRDWKVKVGDYALDYPTYIPEEKQFAAHYVHYAAPEILTDPKGPCDLWSYGMILYTLLVDHRPYPDAKSYAEVINAVKKRVTHVAGKYPGRFEKNRRKMLVS